MKKLFPFLMLAISLLAYAVANAQDSKQCAAKTKQGAQCTRKVKEGTHCWQHDAKAFHCGAETKSKTPCKVVVKKDGDKCHMHKIK